MSIIKSNHSFMNIFEFHFLCRIIKMQLLSKKFYNKIIPKILEKENVKIYKKPKDFMYYN